MVYEKTSITHITRKYQQSAKNKKTQTAEFRVVFLSRSPAAEILILISFL